MIPSTLNKEMLCIKSPPFDEELVLNEDIENEEEDAQHEESKQVASHYLPFKDVIHQPLT